jgi:protein SCO1/2
VGEKALARAVAGVAAAALLALTAACGGSSESDDGLVADVVEGDQDGMHGAVLDAPYTWGQAELTDTAGDAFATRDELAAPLTLVFFGYTNCPDICQAVMADITSALARLDAEQADQVDVWFVTTDPARDDAATLREYLDRFDPSFEGLTGPLERITALAGEVHVAVEEGRRLPTGGYEVNHGTPVLGVRPDGTVPILWTEGTSSSKLAEDITVLLDEPAGGAAPDEEG